MGEVSGTCRPDRGARASVGGHVGRTGDSRGPRGDARGSGRVWPLRRSTSAASCDTSTKAPQRCTNSQTSWGLTAEGAQPTEVTSEWAWLIRRWPKAPALANSDGMPRGIARGSSEPGVDVVTHSAGSAAQGALVAERPTGLLSRTRVQVVGGENAGREGEVARPAWLMDDEHRTVMPGPPPGYEVVLMVPGEECGGWWCPPSTASSEWRPPGPHGEHVIARADGLDPQDAQPHTAGFGGTAELRQRVPTARRRSRYSGSQPPARCCPRWRRAGEDDRRRHAPGEGLGTQP